MNNAGTNSHRAAPPVGASADTIAAFIAASYAVDLAAWLSQLPRSEAWLYHAGLGLSRRAKVFASLPLDVRAELARGASRPALAEIVAGMDADDRADLFNHLTAAEQEQLAQQLDPEDFADIRRLSGMPRARLAR